MNKIKTIISIFTAIGSLIGLILGTLGLSVLFSVDLPGLTILPSSSRRLFIIWTFIILFLTWVLFYLDRRSVIADLQIRLKRQRDLQKSIDELSKLRSEGITTLYAVTPTTKNFSIWLEKFHNWETRVIELMKLRFTSAIVDLFSELGAIPSINFSQVSEDPLISRQHAKQLQILAKELSVLEKVIQTGTQLVNEPTPTFWETIRVDL